MSDLIDFVSPAKEIGLSRPLIPSPDFTLENDPRRCSFDSNPFDLVHKRSVEYERNHDDPFEMVIEKAKDFNFESQDDSSIKRRSRLSEIFKMNRSSSFCDDSIITDLNNTNLLSDVVLPKNDIKGSTIPVINISVVSNNNLSILNNSSMNDNLTEHESNNLLESKILNSVCDSNYFALKCNSPTIKTRRSHLIGDALKNYQKAQNNLKKTVSSVVENDPFNLDNFKTSTFNQTMFSSSSSRNKTFDTSSGYKFSTDRTYSNSSLNSGVSSFSTIPSTSSYSVINFNEEIDSRSKTLECVSKTSLLDDQVSLDEIISQEARILANTLEKMASDTENSNEDIFNIQNNFDELPLSDDEEEGPATENLIELPLSPINKQKDENKIENKEIINIEEEQENIIKNDIKELETELLHDDNNKINDVKKKAMAASLFIDLEKIIEGERNPHAAKMLHDLQKVLGIEFNSNAEILNVCLSKTPEKKIDSEINSDNLPHINVGKANSKKLDKNNSKEEKLSDSEDDSEDDSEAETQSDKNELFDTEKLASELIYSLKNVVTEKNKESAIEFAQNLGNVFNMAFNTPVKNLSDNKNDKRSSFTKRKSESLNRESPKTRLYKSTSSRALNSSIEEKLDQKVLRKSMSMIQTFKNPNTSFLSTYKGNSKSNLSTNVRHTSEPNLINSATNKRLSETSTLVNRSKLNSMADQVKSKLKKKPVGEVVNKKGPLKAVIPLGNMQKNGLGSKKLSPVKTLTPRKSNDRLTYNITSSTPNLTSPGHYNKTLRSKPSASSTPDIEKTLHRSKSQAKNSSGRNSFTCPSSPISMNSSLKERMNSSLNSPKRVTRNTSPKKKLLCSPKKIQNNNQDSRLPRYSPRPSKIRNQSHGDLKTVKSFELSPHSLKHSSFESKLNYGPPPSPLRTCNKNLTPKTKSLSQTMFTANEKFVNRSFHTGPEKENCG